MHFRSTPAPSRPWIAGTATMRCSDDGPSGTSVSSRGSKITPHMRSWRKRPFRPTAISDPTSSFSSAEQKLKATALSAAPCDGVGLEQRSGDRVVDKPHGIWRHDHCRHLQRPLGNRAVLQSLEAEPKGEELRRYQR